MRSHSILNTEYWNTWPLPSTRTVVLGVTSISRTGPNGKPQMTGIRYPSTTSVKLCCLVCCMITRMYRGCAKIQAGSSCSTLLKLMLLCNWCWFTRTSSRFQQCSHGLLTHPCSVKGFPLHWQERMSKSLPSRDTHQEQMAWWENTSYTNASTKHFIVQCTATSSNAISKTIQGYEKTSGDCIKMYKTINVPVAGTAWCLFLRMKTIL